MGWRSALGRFVRNLVVVTTAAVAAFGLFGYLLGGTAGVRGGVLWGLVAGGMSIPAVLMGMVDARGGGVSEEVRDAWAERRFGRQPGGPPGDGTS